jgi:transposase
MIDSKRSFPHYRGMKIGRPKLKLAMSDDLLEKVRCLYRETNDVKVKERAQAVILATGGNSTYQEISDTVGRARSTVQLWIKDFEEQGLDSFPSRQGQGGGRPSPLRDPLVLEEFNEKLCGGEWRTANQAAKWLENEKGIKRSPSSVYYWLGKLGGALKVPRPVHIKKDAAEAESFKEDFYDILCKLAIPPGSRVKIWVQDEARYGLHSLQRRCWGLRGVRVVKPAQQKYDWSYIYGALEVVEGGGFFHYMPTVDLENTLSYLRALAASDCDAEHIVVWDGAGFHQRPEDPDLPERIHLVQLPAYSPELNPIERLWDVVKDQICNTVYKTLDEIETAITEALRPYFESLLPARKLVGDGWMHVEANVSPNYIVPISI